MSVSGAIRYRGGAAVSGVSLAMNGATSAVSDTAGAYALGAPLGATVEVRPSRSGGQTTALTALDAAWILQAIVGNRSLDAEQTLAGDVTGDGTLSSLDAALLLQYVVGSQPGLPAAERCASDWLFIPSPAAAPNQSVILPTLTSSTCSMGAIRYNPLSASAAGQDFRAVLLGDVTGNWTP